MVGSTSVCIICLLMDRFRTVDLSWSANFVFFLSTYQHWCCTSLVRADSSLATKEHHCWVFDIWTTLRFNIDVSDTIRDSNFEQFLLCKNFTCFTRKYDSCYCDWEERGDVFGSTLWTSIGGDSLLGSPHIWNTSVYHLSINIFIQQYPMAVISCCIIWAGMERVAVGE